MNPNHCPACEMLNTGNADFCSKCHFPFMGDEKQRSIHLGTYIAERNILSETKTAVQKSKIVLFLISGLNLLMFLVAIFSPEYLLLDAFINLLFAIIFAMFGMFIHRSPLVFTVIPLIFILMIYSIEATYDLASMAKGIILKLFIIGSLGYGAYKCYKAGKFRKKYN